MVRYSKSKGHDRQLQDVCRKAVHVSLQGRVLPQNDRMTGEAAREEVETYKKMKPKISTLEALKL